MKKAVVIGGSNGIGLALSVLLIKRGYFLDIFDKSVPEEGFLDSNHFNYNSCDLRNFDEDLFMPISQDNEVEILLITAGIGRVADFSAHHSAEIDNIFLIDALSIIKILRIFYHRIQSQSLFFTGVMGSISGWLSSPGTSVYAAAKASVVRLIESVNIELEMSVTDNRILDVSPGAFKGSRFYGGNNDLKTLEPLAEDILYSLFRHDTRFIPQYEEVYKDVFEQYRTEPHRYGLHSYQYKKNSGRLDNGKKVKIGYLSGTFDLFHIGHLNLLRKAKQYCDYLIVGVHDSGKWKGKDTFIPFEERKSIVAACKYVDKVVESCREDSDAWYLWHYDLLFVGSDYKGTERFLRYEEFFQDKDVKIVYFPYTKGTSSTQIRSLIKESTLNSDRNAISE